MWYWIYSITTRQINRFKWNQKVDCIMWCCLWDCDGWIGPNWWRGGHRRCHGCCVNMIFWWFFGIFWNPLPNNSPPWRWIGWHRRRFRWRSLAQCLQRPRCTLICPWYRLSPHRALPYTAFQRQLRPSSVQITDVDDVFDGVTRQTPNEWEARAPYNVEWKVCVRGLKVRCSDSDDIKEYVSDVRFWMKIMSASAMVNWCAIPPSTPHHPPNMLGHTVGNSFYPFLCYYQC